MKKKIFVIICLIAIVFVTGCEKKSETKDLLIEKTSISEEEKVQNNDLDVEEAEQNTPSEKEEITHKDEKNKKEELPNTATSTKPTQNNQQDESQVQVEKTCTPKKFAHKYTYVYESEAVCNANGDQPDAFDYFVANGITASMFGCEKIVDDCGNTYYGVYFTNTKGEKYYY